MAELGLLWLDKWCFGLAKATVWTVVLILPSLAASDFTNNLDTTLASALQSEPPEPALDTPEDAEPENQADQPPVKTKRWFWSRLKLRGTNHSQGRPQHRLPNWLRTLGACFCMRPSGQSQG